MLKPAAFIRALLYKVTESIMNRRYVKNREGNLKYAKQRTKQLKSLGFCIDCGKKPAIHQRVRCGNCLEINANHSKRYYYGRKNNV